MGIVETSQATKRPYLPAEDRRRQLLEAAARLFARDGFAGMTMVALAAEAGVSRQLVYGHFPDVATLYDAFFEDRVARYADAVDQVLSDADPGAPAPVIQVFECLLAIPDDVQRAVRLLIADPGVPELEHIRRRLRSRMLERWTPFVDRADLDREAVEALVWMVAAGLLALADLVGRDDVSLSAAAAAVARLADDVQHVSDDESAHLTRTKGH